MIIFSFDFSMSKPAMCLYDTEERFVDFYCWPSHIDEKTENILKSVNVSVYNRKRPPISKKTLNNNEMVLEHVMRASELSKLITNKIMDIIKEKSINISDAYIITEGLSFGSTGDAALDLSGYKYTMLTSLYDLGVRHIFTYPPISIKSIAGCAKKGMSSKTKMIDAIKGENPNIHQLIKTIIMAEDKLKKKTAFVDVIDDLVDSYWALKTFIAKENVKCNI